MTQDERKTFEFLRSFHEIQGGVMFSWANGEVLDAVQFADGKALERRILGTMAKLPESWAEALRLVCFEGLTTREAAEVMDVSRAHLINLRGLGLRRFGELWGKVPKK